MHEWDVEMYILNEREQKPMQKKAEYAIVPFCS